MTRAIVSGATSSRRLATARVRASPATFWMLRSPRETRARSSSPRSRAARSRRSARAMGALGVGARLARQLDRATRIPQHLPRLDPSDVVEEPGAGGEHPERAAFHLE